MITIFLAFATMIICLIGIIKQGTTLFNCLEYFTSFECLRAHAFFPFNLTFLTFGAGFCIEIIRRELKGLRNN